MARRPGLWFVGLALIVLLISGISAALLGGRAAWVADAQPPSPTATPTPTRPVAHPLPPELAFLAGMSPTERFDHTLLAQVVFRNPQGQEVTLNAIFGKVASVSANTVTITPNGTNQTRTVNVTANTWIVARPRRGTLSVLQPGDRVVVYVVGSSSDAAAIVEWAYSRGMMPMPMDGRGMMPLPSDGDSSAAGPSDG